MSYKNILGLILFSFFITQLAYAAGPASVNLGSAGNFAILSKSGISATGTTSVIGNIGVSPAAATYITGFGLILNSSGQSAISSLVTGKVYASDYSVPTPTTMTTAISDMQTAYTDAAGRTDPTATELGAGNIGGMTLAPGLYTWSTGVTIPTTLTLSGGPNDVWIFQIAQNLNVGNGVNIVLAGGAQPQNIFWQVAGQATLGTTSQVSGIILSQTAIVMNNGASLNGRAFAQTAVTLNAGTVTEPSGSPVIVTTPPPNTTINSIVATSITVTSSNNPVIVGNAITLTASVFPNSGSSINVPNGETITYKLNNNVIGTGKTMSGANALIVSSLGAGIYSITATYAGDANFVTSTSAALSQNVTVQPIQTINTGGNSNVSQSTGATNVTTTSNTVVNTSSNSTSRNTTTSSNQNTTSSNVATVALTAGSTSLSTGQSDTLTAKTDSKGPIQILVDGAVVSTGTNSTTFNAGLLASGNHTIVACDLGTSPVTCSPAQTLSVQASLYGASNQSYAPSGGTGILASIGSFFSGIANAIGAFFHSIGI